MGCLRVDLQPSDHTSSTACRLTHHTGAIAPGPLVGQGTAAVAAARFALLSLPVLPTYHTMTAIAHPRSGLYCGLSTDLLLFAFVYAGGAHVPLASRTLQRLTNAYLTFDA
jgi:hypothetical protein